MVGSECLKLFFIVKPQFIRSPGGFSPWNSSLEASARAEAQPRALSLGPAWETGRCWCFGNNGDLTEFNQQQW